MRTDERIALLDQMRRVKEQGEKEVQAPEEKTLTMRWLPSQRENWNWRTADFWNLKSARILKKSFLLYVSRDFIRRRRKMRADGSL